MLSVGTDRALHKPHIDYVNGRPKVVAAIPAFNESSTIHDVVLRSAAYADEVIVIDDGSLDATGDLALKAGARVLRHDANLGKGAAIKTALAYARNNGVGILVFHDADLQHNPEEIPKVVQPIIQGQADVVIGKRWGKKNGMPPYRRVGKRILDYLTSFASAGRLLTDSQSGFRALSRATVEKIRLESDGYGVESEMTVQFAQKGLRVAEVPVTARYDVRGSKIRPVRHAVQVIFTLVKLATRNRPKLVFGVPAATTLCAVSFIGYTALIGASGDGSATMALLVPVLVLAATGVGLAIRSVLPRPARVESPA